MVAMVSKQFPTKSESVTFRSVLKSLNRRKGFSVNVHSGGELYQKDDEDAKKG